MILAFVIGLNFPASAQIPSNPPPLIPPGAVNCVVDTPFSTQDSLPPCGAAVQPATFAVGVAVRTVQAVPVFTRGGRVKCQQPSGSDGTIISGPNGEYWRVGFEAGCDGWVLEDMMMVVQ